MSNRSADKLIEDVISFIQKERELFGEFSIQNFNPGSKNGDLYLETASEVTVVAESPGKQSSSSHSEHMSPETSEKSDSVSIGKNPREAYDQIDDCRSLEELEELCRQADVLKTDLEGTQLVFGTGNPHADLMLIGEAPGAEEDKQGEPFVGAAGKLLNKILASVNFNREDVYIANILKHRPPKNRDPLPEERERSLPFLLKQIELVDPKLILALGKVSAQTLLDTNDSLSRMRGKFHPFRDKYELLATYHPAALLRYDKWKRPTWEDVQMLRKRYDELNGQP